ncbi:MAG: hypothetical protein ACLP6G_10290 [Terriglobales bacterium]
MKLRIACAVVACLSLDLLLTSLTVAQTSTQTASALPRLVRFGGAVKDLNGSPLTGMVGITFALYSEQSGGAPLWLETQNVTADRTGHYAVLLGATKPEGVPAELFTSEQARWVGVQVSGQGEQPRVLLVSAPYALKAGDAETIGGFPPSAFVLAAPAVTGSAASSSNATAPQQPATVVTTIGGTLNYLPLFNGAASIADSVVFQSGSMVGINTTTPAAMLDVNGTEVVSMVGINTTTPAATLDVNGMEVVRGTLSLPPVGTGLGIATRAATGTAGLESQGLNLVALSVRSPTATAVNQTFRWQAEPAASNTANPSGTLNLLYGPGATPPGETGLMISSKGLFTFATGQTFPGTGTVESVALSAPATDFTVSGSPVASTGTLNIAWKVAPTSTNTASAIVKRDSSGSFAASAISASAITADAIAAAAMTASSITASAITASDSGTGVTGFPAVFIRTDSSNSVPLLAQNTANHTFCEFDNNGNLLCSGTKNAVVPIDSGKRKVALSAIESPKNWFEDAGASELVNGSAVVALDPDFVQTVNTELEYMVFPVPNGDCKGLYVTHQTPTSFEVHELGGGTSNVRFYYRIMALRKKYENVRFADHTDDPDPMKMLQGGHGAGATNQQSQMPTTKLSPAGPLVQTTAAQ